MSTVNAVAGVLRMLESRNFSSRLQCMSKRAVGILPMEIVVVLHTQVAIRIQKGRVGKVVVAVENTRRHACASEGLREVVARVDTRSIDLLRGHFHCRTRHPLGLDALYSVVLRQCHDSIQRNIHDEDAPHLVYKPATVPMKEGGSITRCRQGD